MSKNTISISVRELVEFVMKSGDIKSIFLSPERGVEGTKAHQKIQKIYSDEYRLYIPEMFISRLFEFESVDLELRGRVDGVIIEDGQVIIDEIKSVKRDLKDISDDFDLKHWAQVKLYAYMYAEEKDMEDISVQLSYVDLETLNHKKFTRNYKKEELKHFFHDIARKYLILAEKMVVYNSMKNSSIESLNFPYSEYRKGQRELAVSVYKVILEDKKLFIRAPTGIGKTIGILFPSIKSLLKQPGKIFYLTATNIGREVAEKALCLLEENGLYLKRVTITSKDKICLNTKKKCDGNFCPYAKGHYDRINDAVSELIETTHNYDREIITEYAQKHQICPYELSLDLSLYCDCIICDYNYAFDPSSVLKRYFVTGNDYYIPENSDRYIFLVDEAHNLAERARDMYSSVLSKKEILSLKKIIKDKDKKLHNILNKLNKIMIDKRHLCDEKNQFVDESYPEDFVELLREFSRITEKIFFKLSDWEYTDELLDFYFSSRDFIKKIELYDEKYTTYYEKTSDDFFMKIFCLDPSSNLKSYMENATSAILFSATLIPMKYFIDILGGNTKSYALKLDSPFDMDNLCLLINNGISTKFKNRTYSYGKIADNIYSILKQKKGNYIAFFPSYKYLEEVYNQFISRTGHVTYDVMKQERGFTDNEKSDFLEAFHQERKNTLVAFAVLGGMFGEGIDLKGEKLSGVIVIGVGLPSICLERNLIKEYFDKDSGKGYQYAYMYPGMNKVIQAAGRVIRSDSDIGTVLLIDERFSQTNYRKLFPPEWKHAKYHSNGKVLGEHVRKFWKTSAPE